jgi:FkbM family methyltransferase
MIRNFRFMNRVLRIKPNLVIHVGADKGQNRSTYLAMGAEKIIWCEADPLNIEFLENKFPTDRVIPAIVWDTDGDVLDFYVSDNSAQNSAIKPLKYKDLSVDKIKCRASRLDTLLYDQKLNARTLLVIDVQGAEEHVLRGAIKTLKKIEYVIIEIALVNQGYEFTPSEKSITSFLANFDLRPSISRVSHDLKYKDQLYLKKPRIILNYINLTDYFFDIAMRIRHYWQYGHLPTRHYFCPKCIK